VWRPGPGSTPAARRVTGLSQPVAGQVGGGYWGARTALASQPVWVRPELATAAGGSLREVMHRLGHTTTVAAVRYQHVMAERDAAIARELNRLIEGA
jgi:hypothetical protein